MATGDERDEEALAQGLSRWVLAQPELVARVAGGLEGGDQEGGGFSVQGVAHAAGGIANETLLVDLGPASRGVVVRLPPLEPTFPDYDLVPQAVVQNAVASAGVPAPAPAARRQRPAVDRLPVPGDAPGGRGRPWSRPPVRPLRARRGTGGPARHA